MAEDCYWWLRNPYFWLYVAHAIFWNVVQEQGCIRAMVKNRKKPTPSPKRERAPESTANQLVLGFCLGSFMTLLTALLTWGGSPTPKRLIVGLILLLAVGIYPAWCFANATARSLNRYLGPARFLALVLLLLTVGVLGKELWPPLPLVTIQIAPSSFPIAIPPASVVSILQIHPYIALTDADDGLLKDSNDTNDKFAWPSQGEIDSKEKNAHEAIFRIEATNHSSQILIGGKLLFKVRFAPGHGNPGNCTSTPKDVQILDVVLIPSLDPGKSLSFYAVNQSAYCAWLIPPENVTVRMANDDEERVVPLSFDKNPLYKSGAPSFFPSTVKWEALPTTPGQHYRVIRITH